MRELPFAVDACDLVVVDAVVLEVDLGTGWPERAVFRGGATTELVDRGGGASEVVVDESDDGATGGLHEDVCGWCGRSQVVHERPPQSRSAFPELGSPRARRARTESSPTAKRAGATPASALWTSRSCGAWSRLLPRRSSA